ncbi:MAG: PEGA domain-containing protein [Myxococcota bacterium]
MRLGMLRWARTGRHGLGTLLCATLLFPSAAAAGSSETAALLPAPSGDSTSSPEQRLRAVASVREVLEAEGMKVLGSDDVRRRLPDALQGCDKTDCADDVAQAVRADFVAGVAVWTAESNPATVAVSLVTPCAHTFPGSAKVDRGDIESAARAALAAALRKKRLGPGPWIRVHGEPIGAKVFIDDEPVGVLPYRAAIRPGRHEVAVRLDGYATAERTVDVRMTDHEEVDLRVDLPSQAPAAADTPPPEARPTPPAPRVRSPVHLWGPVALGTAGVGLLTHAAVALARKGCAQGRAGGGCVIRRDLKTVPFALTAGFGAAALTGALLWFVLTGGDEEGDDDRVPKVTLGPTRVGLHLKF